jgi:hypothetical protein
MKTYSFVLTEAQVATLARLADAAVRAGGIKTAKEAIPVLDDMAWQMEAPAQAAGAAAESAAPSPK